MNEHERLAGPRALTFGCLLGIALYIIPAHGGAMYPLDNRRGSVVLH